MSDTDFYKPGETEFRGWWPGGPAHDVEKTCTMMWTYDRKWYDWYCPTLYKAACVDVKEYVVPVTMQVIKVRLERTNSDVDPNDPTFQEEMLLKMKKELRDKGLDDNIQLTWRKQPDGQVFQKEEKKRDEL
ncbi:hypothetical protein F7725_026043 [Dissostichus mawsoni]|uniref:Uncharacterized protein n=1 Tax=Dissostichus mawsoni TaxID=36200 RepID=A0A7J5X7F9_DISMA|nr:hypothetical protein F7725_026043 [Dissostichus mawsoni]